MVMAGALSLARGRAREEERLRSRKAAKQAMAASRHAAPELSAMVDRIRPAMSSRTCLSFIFPHPSFLRRHLLGATRLHILNPATDSGVGAGPHSLAGTCPRSFWAISAAPHLHILNPANDRGMKVAGERPGRRRTFATGDLLEPVGTGGGGAT